MYCLIYLLTNTLNNKVYVGQTWKTLAQRFGYGYKGSLHIFNAINKYGKENFRYTILTVCSTQKIANYWEDYFIVKYDSINTGYNIKNGGSKGKHSEETKKKMSESHSGENHHLYGKSHSDETIKKMSDIKIGKVFTEEHKTNLAKAKIGKKRGSPSEKTKKKMSDAKIGRVISEETRNKISKSSIGKVIPEKVRQKISLSLRGENGPNAKLSNNQRLEIIEKRENKVPIKLLMSEYNVSKQTIIRVSKGK
jgi:group I intron endonuclease